MYSKIMVGYDASDQAKDALAFGKELADATGAELFVAGVFVIYPTRAGIDPAVRESQAEFARDIEQAANSVDAVAQPIAGVSPARGLTDLAEQVDVDLLVVGSAHHGALGQALVGNVGLALLHGAPCSVAIAPRGYRDREAGGIATVAVGVDGSPEAGAALTEAIELAQATGARLKLVAVAEPPVIGIGTPTASWHELRGLVEDQMNETLSQALAGVPDGVEAEAKLVSGEAVEGLTAEAAQPGTVLVLGSRGYGPVRRVLLGSVSSRLARSVPCPLIVHPRGADDASRKGDAAEAQAVS